MFDEMAAALAQVWRMADCDSLLTPEVFAAVTAALAAHAKVAKS